MPTGRRNRAVSRVLVAAVASLIWTVCSAAGNSSSLDLESHKFVDAAVVAIVSSWNVDELLRRASPEMLAEAELQIDINSLFDKWRPLGGLIAYAGSTGGAKIVESPEVGEMVTAEYAARAAFQNGTAEINVELVKRNGSWSILSFKVDPNLKQNHPA